MLRNETLYIFDKDSYDDPVDSIELEVYTLNREPGIKTKYNNKEWVLELLRNEEKPLCLAAENEQVFRKWNDKINDAIEESLLGSGNNEF